MEVSNFNFRHVRLCDLNISREKMAKLFANNGDPDQIWVFTFRGLQTKIEFMGLKFHMAYQNYYPKVSVSNKRVTQGCHSQGKKSGKWKFFQVKGKSGNFGLSQGNWKKLTKVWGISKFSENWDGYGRLFNFRKHKFTELASFFCYMIVLFSESKCCIGRFDGWGQM